MDWHIHYNGAVKGPYSDEQVQALCDAGAITGATMVWTEGYPDWKPLADTGLFVRAPVGPPPLRTPEVSHRPLEVGPRVPLGAPDRTGPASTNGFVVDQLSMWDYFTRAVGPRYATFDGRARRKEYWSFALFYLIFFVAIIVLGSIIDGMAGNVGTGSAKSRPIYTGLLAVLYVLAMFIPSLSILVRRIHDIGMSGWFAAVMLLPYIGGIISLIFTLIPTQMRANDYGPAPVPELPK